MAERYKGSLDRRPSGTWRWRVQIDGESFTFHWENLNREEAEKKASLKYWDLLDRVRRGSSPDMRLSTLLKRFEDEEVSQLADGSKRAYKATLNGLRTYLVKGNNPRLSDISKGDLKRYLHWRRRRGPDGIEREDPLSGHTLKREYSVIRRLFEWAAELELVTINPANQISAPKAEEREPVLLTDEQLSSLLDACSDDMLRMYVLLVAETGLRPSSEALWLKWENLDLEDGFLQVVSGRGGHDTKTKKGRWVPLTPRLREALRKHAARYRFSNRSEWVFHKIAGDRWGEPGDRRKDFDTSLSTAIEKAELPAEFRFYDLRHRRCTRWLAQGHSPALVRRAMGHTDLSTTLQYEHLVRGDLESLLVAGEEPRDRLKGLTG